VRLNRLEWMLIGASVLALAAAWLFTYRSIVEDRETTRSASVRIVDSLAVGLEEHLAVTLRDARNTAHSAAVIIEDAGGLGGFKSAASLHRALHRELHDVVSTTRLIAVDLSGRVVASSAEFPLPEAPANRAILRWHAAHPKERGFHLGVPHLSAAGTGMVIPYSRAIFDRNGTVTGAVIAELRAEYLARVYAALAQGSNTSTVVFNHDGVILMRVPYEERIIGRFATSMDEFRAMLKASGNLEWTSGWDSKTRFYSHRVLVNDPVVIAVGVDRDLIMQPAATRTRYRLALMIAATLVFLALVWLLVAELRRLKRSEMQRRAVSQRLMDVEETERRSINRELHDRVGQNLSALQLNLATLRIELDGSATRAVSERLNDAQSLLQAASNQVRDVMANLRPAALDDFGLIAALRDHVAAVAARLGIAISLRGEEPQPRLPQATELALFRIVQEALNNVAMHARARRVEITLTTTGRSVRLSVADDGVGFDVRQPRRRAAHYGLATMRERAEAVGAQLRFVSRPGRGTRVEIELRRDAA
jgi:signal transduction histidine kinase